MTDETNSDINYGPVDPIEDPDTAVKLAELLREGGLVPLDVNSILYASMTPTTFEITPPGRPYAILGMTSRHSKEDRIKIVRAEILDRIVIRDVDASAYNLGHLVPNDLGVIDRNAPMSLTVQCDRVSDIPDLAITFWGKVYDPATKIDRLKRRVAQSLDPIPRRQLNLMKALKLLKEHDVEVEDDDLRSLLDKYASVL